MFVVVTCFSTFLQRTHFTCESFFLLLSHRCILKVLSLFGVFLAQHRFVLNGRPTVTLQNGATDSASFCEFCNRIDEVITCSIVWNRGCAERFDSHVCDGQHCDSLLRGLRRKQQSVTNVCDLCDNTRHETQPHNNRVGALVQSHPGDWITPVGPGRTSTVQRCPSRWEGSGWPETTTICKKTTAHSNRSR